MEGAIGFITLRHDAERLWIAPALGGSIVRYARRSARGTVDWLRPAAQDALKAADPTGMACFPLVPFSNRIRDGRFAFGERSVALQPNFPPQRHAIHGQGWRAPWRVVEHGEATLFIEYIHDPGDWPWAYRARQGFALGAEGLEMTISVINESPEPMPAGLGLHPYFQRTPRATIRAGVAGVWQTDKDVMPTDHSVPPAGADPSLGIAADRVALDNVFTGWDGTAVLDWPERDARLTLRASEAFGFLVIFTPAGEDFFCAEPVSHCTDAFNLAAAGADGTGMAVLAPGAELSGTVTLSPETGPLDRMPGNP